MHHRRPWGRCVWVGGRGAGGGGRGRGGFVFPTRRAWPPAVGRWSPRLREARMAPSSQRVIGSAGAGSQVEKRLIGLPFNVPPHAPSSVGLAQAFEELLVVDEATTGPLALRHFWMFQLGCLSRGLQPPPHLCIYMCTHMRSARASDRDGSKEDGQVYTPCGRMADIQLALYRHRRQNQPHLRAPKRQQIYADTSEYVAVLVDNMPV